MPEIPKNIEQKDLVKYLTTVVALVKKLKNATRLELEEITNKIDKLKIKKGDKGEDGRDGTDGRGGGGGGFVRHNDFYSGNSGSQGVVRIIWGATRSFPSTNVDAASSVVTETTV